ncbi:MAG TPA: ABC transporter ATP-binding protein [Candidatus Pullilachnospira intestinigallinarum]|nr:ABC transporter ATP-binding protein [Candidatus Pullilachnospira intestinigallinarum]
MRIEEQEYTKNFDIRIWKRVLPFLAPFKGCVAVMLIFNLICSLVDIVMPLFQRYAIDHFIGQGSLAGIWKFGAVYALVVLGQFLSVVCFTRASAVLEMSVGKTMKRACFVHLQELSFSYYNVTPVGYILSRVMSDTDRIAGMVAWNVSDMLWAFVYVLGVFVAMLLLNWKLALIIILIVPALAILTWYFQNKILRWNRHVRKINSRITSGYNEGIMGAQTSKTLVIEEKNLREFQDITTEMRTAAVKAARLSAVYVPLVLFCGSLATAIVLGRGGQMVQENLLAIGTLSAFTSYAVGIFEPIQQLARNLAELISIQANIERVNTLLDQEPMVVDSPEVVERYGDTFHPKKENWEPIRGDIEFRDVSFHYPDGKEEVLSHFNLKVPAGTTVAIVGETGAGKSTLVNLACRFFEPTGGEILIDGVDYRKRSQLWLHSNIGYVLQNPHLFSGTIEENIRYGRLDATPEEIRQAAKAVSADLVAEKLEKGYQTDVGEGGNRLSTGEKQLVSFARAILADPRIFVLDEATSSIDTQTEQLIQKATETLLRGRTSFIIAHRLSTIRHADVILVVRDGKIIEQGTHQQLLSKKGYYYRLCRQQFQEENTGL